MKKFVCSVCGYVYEGEEAPAQCPVCKAPAEKFIKQGDDPTTAWEKAKGQYGRVADAAKIIDPRKE